MRPGTVLVGMLNPFDTDNIAAMAQHGLTAFALEAAPRITRAQSMDVLSSQANIAGYKAVMLAANTYQRFMPMLMTAAGTVKAARVLIMGVGVAGLQAIATAKRLGAVIEASDVRPAGQRAGRVARRQIHRRAFPDRRRARDRARRRAAMRARCRRTGCGARRELVHERAKQADIVITTALIPGRTAPVLIARRNGARP